MLLKIAVQTHEDARQPVDHSILCDGRPVAGSVSPRQEVNARHDLAIRMPGEVGEYAAVFKWSYAGEPAYLSLPLFVLPYPPM